MKLGEYVRTVYPIKEVVNHILSNPAKRAIDRDNLPFDSLKEINGVLIKHAVYGDESMPVEDLVLMTKNEVIDTGNVDLLRTWNRYQEMVVVKDVEMYNGTTCE